jgi:hypothetical protein
VGHIGVKGLYSAVDSLPLDDSSPFSCDVCAQANIKCSPFPNRDYATCLLKCIHCDVCGPLPCCYGNFSYYILFIDYYSRFITLFLMKSRDEALSLFVQFQNALEHFCQHAFMNNAGGFYDMRLSSKGMKSGHFHISFFPRGPFHYYFIPTQLNVSICVGHVFILFHSLPAQYFNPCQLSISFFPCAIFQSTRCLFISIIILPYATFHSFPMLFFNPTGCVFISISFFPCIIFQSTRCVFISIIILPYATFHSFPMLFFNPTRCAFISISFFPYAIFQSHRVCFHIYYHSSLCAFHSFPMLFFNPTRCVFISISFFPCIIFQSTRCIFISIIILPYAMFHSFPMLFFNPTGWQW